MFRIFLPLVLFPINNFLKSGRNLSLATLKFELLATSAVLEAEEMYLVAEDLQDDGMNDLARAIRWIAINSQQLNDPETFGESEIEE